MVKKSFWLGGFSQTESDWEGDDIWSWIHGSEWDFGLDERMSSNVTDGFTIAATNDTAS